ncbi:MAG: hypothetical protein GX230_00840 [Lentisphaerae bacterium]|jgi:hypothetical protein|nr:hypothetical protein [Lentisphaerota bacterium]
MKHLPKFTMGVGDRFGHQCAAQLRALLRAGTELGTEVAPVWNKSNREHQIIGTRPADARAAADRAVALLGYKGAYFLDADHIGLKNVDLFLEPCDFFTLDVADFVGQPAPEAEIEAFVARHSELVGEHKLPVVGRSLVISTDDLTAAARAYLAAVRQAGEIYRYIAARKGSGNFITEVSMDETDKPQTPAELLVILVAIAEEKIPAQTIAPKFTGRFNKGVDYVGDVATFNREFEDDLAVIRWAVENLELPDDLKISVHSGSDKFSIYPGIGAALSRFGAGIHIKTAGTTWLEEVTGLALAGGSGLELAKEIAVTALPRMAELCAPYATVIDIDATQLPTAEEINGWSSEEYANALRHEQECPGYNPHFRQLIHVSFRVAAEMGERYRAALREFEPVIAKEVEGNLFERHLKRLLG